MRLALYLDDGLICGGAENVARRLIAHWASRGHTVFLVSRKISSDSFFALPAGVTAIPLLPSVDGITPASGKLPPGKIRPALRSRLPGRSFMRLLYEAFLLRRVLCRLNVDVAIAFLTPANVKLLIACAGLKPRTLISERSDTRHYIYPRMWLRLRRLLYWRADLVTANLSQSIDDMARYLPASRLRLLPNPVDLPGSDELADTAQAVRILAVGRLVPYKRHLTLIRAFAQLGEEFAHWHLDILGEGPLRDELTSAAEHLGIGNRVHLHGRRNDIDNFYQQAAIFVLPSQVEGTPNVLLEAMAYALPSIVSDIVASASECFDHGISGILFRFDDVSDLAERLADLARQPQLRQAIGQAARQRLIRSESIDAYGAWDSAILCATGARERSAE